MCNLREYTYYYFFLTWTIFQDSRPYENSSFLATYPKNIRFVRKLFKKNLRHFWRKYVGPVININNNALLLYSECAKLHWEPRFSLLKMIKWQQWAIYVGFEPDTPQFFFKLLPDELGVFGVGRYSIKLSIYINIHHDYHPLPDYTHCWV